MNIITRPCNVTSADGIKRAMALSDGDVRLLESLGYTVEPVTTNPPAPEPVPPYRPFGRAIADATRVMVSQRNKGINKYGVTIEDAGLNAVQLLQHAREEAADLSVYLAQLEQTLQPHGWVMNAGHFNEQRTREVEVANEWVKQGWYVQAIYIGGRYQP